MAFTEMDLLDLELFLDRASSVIPYCEVAWDDKQAGTVAMRHDVDHSIDKAVKFAEWEAKNGFRSSYFILHSADYWDGSSHFYNQVCRLSELGHEVGLHNDALCATDGHVTEAVGLLRQKKHELEHAINGVVYGIADHGGAPHTNGDIWISYTPESLGFEYEAYQLQKTANTYISDNQGRWRSELKMAQTFMLVHPTWWPV